MERHSTVHRSPRRSSGPAPRSATLALLLLPTVAAPLATSATGGCSSRSDGSAEAPASASAGSSAAATGAPAQAGTGAGAQSAAAPAPGGTPEEIALARANAAADDLARTLRARLLEAMAEGGPARAASVCAEDAQHLTAQVRERNQALVGRSALRLRSQRNAAPTWVGDWLEAHAGRQAADVRGFAKVEGGVARVLRPIAVEGPCLACHGPRDSLSPEVRALLSERYPDDEAVDYALGDLRGALYAEVAVR
jgi:hypothetical protein